MTCCFYTVAPFCILVSCYCGMLYVLFSAVCISTHRFDMAIVGWRRCRERGRGGERRRPGRGAAGRGLSARGRREQASEGGQGPRGPPRGGWMRCVNHHTCCDVLDPCGVTWTARTLAAERFSARCVDVPSGATSGSSGSPRSASGGDRIRGPRSPQRALRDAVPCQLHAPDTSLTQCQCVPGSSNANLVSILI